MASAPQNVALPLFYNDLVLLSSQEHSGWKSRGTDKATWLAGTNTVPLTVEEFPLAQRNYPIIFSAGDDAVPLVELGTPMSDAILAISTKSFGCVGVVASDNRLVGIVTDGDLRRHMSPRLLELPIEQVMTRDPRSIGPDVIASVALEIMNSSKIMALFVVEEGRPVGIVHVHDTLRAGVA